jgi:hypothetical protein
MTTAKDRFTAAIQRLFDRFGQEGEFHSIVASIYDPNTGETNRTETVTTVQFVHTDINTLGDIDPKEKFIQFDEGLAKLQQSVVSFIIKDKNITVNETGYIVTATSKHLWFSKIKPWMVNDTVLVYTAEIGEEYE